MLKVAMQNEKKVIALAAESHIARLQVWETMPRRNDGRLACMNVLRNHVCPLLSHIRTTGMEGGNV